MKNPKYSYNMESTPKELKSIIDDIVAVVKIRDNTILRLMDHNKNNVKLDSVGHVIKGRRKPPPPIMSEKKISEREALGKILKRIEHSPQLDSEEIVSFCNDGLN